MVTGYPDLTPIKYPRSRAPALRAPVGHRAELRQAELCRAELRSAGKLGALPGAPLQSSM